MSHEASKIGERRWGLALSGGLVRGAAHVGVLKVLEAHGLRPHAIAGTSVGAIVGASYASGRPLSDLETVFRELAWSALIRPTIRLRRSLLQTRGLTALLRDRLGLTTFESLRIPFAAVACELRTGRPVALRSGDLLHALRASCALPGLFPPESEGDRLLVDGGIVANLPVDFARRLGADYVVAVDLLPAGDRPARLSSLFEIWQRSLHLMIRGNHSEHGRAEITLSPDIADLSFTRFEEVPELIHRGERAALAMLEGGGRT